MKEKYAIHLVNEGQTCDNCDRPLSKKRDKKRGMCSKCFNALEKFLQEVGNEA